ncbi:YwqI/YxiC family protein [Bacillus sp. FJAT-47783]|uniref:YwqI/YxiC family protein n=1 Tax=Bacillus sp. FJAT-47783 TaxID=2922712 RepID=UPI001FAB9360|nr:YwqI/YxiC family protein [Bacillus sp. FJAT-47783]
MAAPTIKIDTNELQMVLNKLDTAMDEFTSYTTTFRENTRNQLKGFHSDFIDQVDALLDNMNDDINTDLLKTINKIHQAGEELLKNMKNADEGLGESIRGARE